MRFSHFFIDRPIFAAVIAVVITVIGAIAFTTLPVSQYPDVAPPTITVSTQYPGASAKVVAETVATPLEQEINGVENMLYMQSQSSNDGAMTISVTFEPGTDLEEAQVQVQNRVAVAEPRLPEEVRRIGLVTRKALPDFLMVIHLLSPDKTYDQIYMSNYASLQLRDALLRIDGVGDIPIFGARDYSMRIWLDPDRISSLGLTATDVLSAIRAQNRQVAGGVLGQPPQSNTGAFQTNIQLLGRLDEVGEFENIIVSSGKEGRVIRLKDVAKIELGAADYAMNAYLDGQTAVVMGVFQRPGSNALETAENVQAKMEELSKSFPPGLQYQIIYNPTEFIAESIDELERTIFIAVALVVFVVLLFLQRWRAAVIPILAIPVSLVGTFVALAALGYSLNNLSLFGLVLAVGIVVDDAIVVVENVERNLARGLSPRDATRRTMDEVGGALISIALVLSAVFVPTAFLQGISGAFYRQFAATVAVATLISCFVSLTLSPALCAWLLRPHGEGTLPKWLAPITRLFSGFNRGFAWVAERYGTIAGGLTRRAALALSVYGVLIALTAYGFATTPTGFVPQQDQGYFVIPVQLPEGSSLTRTDDVVRRVEKVLLAIPGVAHTAAFSGFSGATFTNASNAGAIFATLLPFEDRARLGLSADSVLGEIRKQLGQFEEAFVLAFPPPPIQGVGNAGGFTMMVQDRGGLGPEALAQATWGLVGAASQKPGLADLFTAYSSNTPQVFVDVDRTKAQMLNVPVSNVFEAMEAYLGSAYVNDFNYLGRTYRVVAQAKDSHRFEPEDIARLKTRSADGAIVPLGSLAKFNWTTSPELITRFNLYPAAALNGNYLPSISSGQALDAMEATAAEALPAGISFEWTDIAFQERLISPLFALGVFAMGVLFVYLVLSAQYESWTLPLAIILIVPMCLLAGLGGVLLRDLDNNILVQIGFLVLIGLASKNAVLIVEFARQLETQGRDRFAAVVEAARLRLRPILMTSMAFIFGVVPLALATGAGAEMRQSLGTAVFFGMIGVTVFGLIFTPVLYTTIRGLFSSRKNQDTTNDVEAAPIRSGA